MVEGLLAVMKARDATPGGAGDVERAGLLKGVLVAKLVLLLR